MKLRSLRLDDVSVRAILDGCKTQFRVPMKPQPQRNPKYLGGYSYGPVGRKKAEVSIHSLSLGAFQNLLPYAPGDILWVREAWQQTDDGPVIYRADYENCSGRKFAILNGGTVTIATVDKWRPSVHMPRWASRLILRVTRAWTQKLQDTTNKEAISEGIQWLPDVSIGTPRTAFARIWDYKYAKKGFSWEMNPWVWAVEFKVDNKKKEET